MVSRIRGTIGAIVCLAVAWLGGAAAAAPCRTSGPYDKWLAEFEREALAKGVSQQSIAAAAPYLTYDQRIVNIDRGQRVFTQTFLEFSDRMAAAYRIQRGDLRPSDMVGSCAGELGQTQMMPSEYYQYAVDYDGDGARNLLRSAPDVLASTANYLTGLRWRRDEPWLTEVRVPTNVPWQQADLDIKLPRASGLPTASPLPMAGRCQRTICRLRYCCRWAASARPSWPMTISASICSGTTL